MLNSLEQRCLDLLEDLNVWLTKKVKPKQFIELAFKRLYHMAKGSGKMKYTRFALEVKG